MPNGIIDGFFHWRIKVTYHFEKRYRLDITILKDKVFHEKPVQNTIFIKKKKKKIAGYWSRVSI